MDYTAAGLLTSFAKPSGTASTFTYDGQGRLTRDANAAGGYWQLEKSGESSTSWSDSYTVSLNSAMGRSTTFFERQPVGDYSPSQSVRRVTTPEGGTTVTTTTPGRSSTTQTPDGTVGTKQYAPDPRFGMQAPISATRTLKRPSGVTFEQTNMRQITVTSDGDPAGLLETMSVNDRVYTRAYDRAANTITSTSPEGRLRVVELNANGDPVHSQSGSLAPAAYSYDTAGHLVEATRESGDTSRSVSYRYYLSGPATNNLASVTDALGRKTSYSYDLAGRITQETLPDGRSIAFGYDENGNLTALTTPAGVTHRFAYTALDQTDSYSAPAVGGTPSLTTYSYNLDKDLTAITRPDGTNVVFNYDNAGRLADISIPRGAYDYTYQPHTRLIANITAPDGNSLHFTYDGSVPESEAWSGAVSGTVESAFDQNFRLAMLTVDGGTVNYFYDQDGLLTRAGVLQIDRDQENGLPSTETVSGYTALLKNDLTYNAFGEVAQFHSVWDSGTTAQGPEGFATVAQDRERSVGVDSGPACGEPTETPRSVPNGHKSGSTIATPGDIEGAPGAMPQAVPTGPRVAFTIVKPPGGGGGGTSSVLYDAHYTRDALGRITGKTETVQGVTHQYAYHYDLAGRLDQVTVDGVSSAYQYDSNGNRLAHVTASGVVDGTYDAQDRLLSYGEGQYTYTANGDLQGKTTPAGTTTYHYDALGNLLGVKLPNGKSIDYVIDGRNRRIGKKIDGVLVRGFLYRDQLRPVAEVDASGTVTERFVYGTQGNVPAYLVKDGRTYGIVSDLRGSVRLVVDVDTGDVVQRMDYDEFGRVITDTNPGFQPFGFAGGLYDRDTGLVRFGARDYDPEVGRWTAKDPIGFGGGDSNLYGYTLNDPVNLVDPGGLSGTLVINAVGTHNGSSGSGGRSGHAWISYTPDGGATTTYGTWGNNPMGLGNGLHENLETGRQGDATRSAYLNDEQEARLYQTIDAYQKMGENGWGYLSPCSSFASNAWENSTGEGLSPYGPYSNPSSLKNSIIEANGGVAHGTLNQGGGW